MQKPRALMVAVGIVLAGCSAAATPSPPPTELNPGPTASRAAVSSATPTTAATTPADGLDAPDALPTIPPDSLAVVTTNDLVVRSQPEVSEASTIHPSLLQDGELLFVLQGPVGADGHVWYQVAYIGSRYPHDVAPSTPPWFGWVAAGRPDDIWIARWNDDCPQPTLEELWREHGFILLACFGGRELQLEGTLARCSYVVPGTISPSWLATEFCELVPFDVPPNALDVHSGFAVHQERGEPVVSEQPVPVRIVGHFDDRAARTCQEHTATGPEPRPPELVVLQCRASFVATEIAEIGDR